MLRSGVSVSHPIHAVCGLCSNKKVGRLASWNICLTDAWKPHGAAPSGNVARHPREVCVIVVYDAVKCGATQQLRDQTHREPVYRPSQFPRTQSAFQSYAHQSPSFYAKAVKAVNRIRFSFGGEVGNGFPGEPAGRAKVLSGSASSIRVGSTIRALRDAISKRK